MPRCAAAAAGFVACLWVLSVLVGVRGASSASVPGRRRKVKNDKRRMPALSWEEVERAVVAGLGRLGRSTSIAFARAEGKMQFLSEEDCGAVANCLGRSDLSPVAVAELPKSPYEPHVMMDREGWCRDGMMCRDSMRRTLAWRLGKREAVLIAGMTPPEQREFTFANLLYSRAASVTRPQALAVPMVGGEYARPQRDLLLAQLGRSISNLPPSEAAMGIHVEAQKWRGVDAQPFAIIVSPSRNSTMVIKEFLVGAGFPADSINVMPIPRDLSAELHLGHGAEADLFTTVLRMHVPRSRAATAKYVGNPPLKVFRLSPFRHTHKDGEMQDLVRVEEKNDTFPWFWEPESEDGALHVSGTGATRAGQSAGGSKGYMESAYDDYRRPIDLSRHLDLLATSQSGDASNAGEPLAVERAMSGRECINTGTLCAGLATGACVAETAAPFRLSPDAATGLAAVHVVGVLHGQTNHTDRVYLSVIAADSNQQILTLDERAFSRSAREALKRAKHRSEDNEWVVEAAPVYNVKFALTCSLQESNCFSLGEKMDGVSLRIEEQSFPTPDMSAEAITNSIIRPRLVAIPHPKRPGTETETSDL